MLFAIFDGFGRRGWAVWFERIPCRRSGGQRRPNIQSTIAIVQVPATAVVRKGFRIDLVAGRLDLPADLEPAPIRMLGNNQRRRARRQRTRERGALQIANAVIPIVGIIINGRIIPVGSHPIRGDHPNVPATGWGDEAEGRPVIAEPGMFVVVRRAGYAQNFGRRRQIGDVTPEHVVVAKGSAHYTAFSAAAARDRVANGLIIHRTRINKVADAEHIRKLCGIFDGIGPIDIYDGVGVDTDGKKLAVIGHPGYAQSVIRLRNNQACCSHSVVVVCAHRGWIVIVVHEIPAVDIIDKAIAVIVHTVYGIVRVGENVGGKVGMIQFEPIIQYRHDDIGTAAGDIPSPFRANIAVQDATVLARVVKVPLGIKVRVVREKPGFRFPKTVSLSPFNQIQIAPFQCRIHGGGWISNFDHKLVWMIPTGANNRSIVRREKRIDFG